MRLYLVRHGKTEWNRAKRFQGQKNSPLLEEGREQARRLGRSLEGKTFAACFCSPLERTRETAGLMNLNQEFIPDEAFMEIDLGLLEGECFGRIRPELEPVVDQFWNSPETFDKKLTGGEDFEDIRKRAVGRIEEIVSEHGEDDDILIVSHGALLKSILNHYERRDLKDFWAPPFLQPASLSVLRFENGLFKNVESRDDTSHYA